MVGMRVATFVGVSFARLVEVISGETTSTAELEDNMVPVDVPDDVQADPMMLITLHRNIRPLKLFGSFCIKNRF
jgi:hypothetical protein